MKKTAVFFGILVLILAVCFSGCSEQKKNDIIITDCKSGEIAAGFSSKEHQPEAAALTDALNNLEDVSGQIDYSQKYSVHFIDPKDSLYDVWFFVYVNNDNNEIFVQYDLENMKELDDKLNKFFDDKIRKSPNLTVSKFLSIISEY